MSCNPAIRYAGSKRKLTQQILEKMPQTTKLIVEPFCGSAAFSFSQDKQFVLNDASLELINFYKVLQLRTEEFISALKKLDSNLKDKARYLQMRELDRLPNFEGVVSTMDRAIRYYYIIRSGFNGLYRVNGKGYCNTPFGDRCYSTDEVALREAASHLNKYCLYTHSTQFDSEGIIPVNFSPDEVFVFIDPPYQTGDDGKKVYQEYTADKVDEAFYARLDKYLDMLDERGYKFLLTNTYCKFITERFARFNVDRLPIKYSIAADGEKRGTKFEAFIYN
jgi:DNA adenine methylase